MATGNITVAGGNNNTKVAFKNCQPFIRSIAHLNDEHVDTAENLDLTTASLYQYKRPEVTGLGDITTNISLSFKYQSSLIGIASSAVAANTNPDVLGAHRLWN